MDSFEIDADVGVIEGGKSKIKIQENEPNAQFSSKRRRKGDKVIPSEPLALAVGETS